MDEDKQFTDPDLWECIYQYSMGQGRLLMEEICIENGYDKRYKVVARALDSIGWWRFMEGVVCKEIRAIPCTHTSVTGLRCNTECRGRGLSHASSRSPLDMTVPQCLGTQQDKDKGDAHHPQKGGTTEGNRASAGARDRRPAG